MEWRVCLRWIGRRRIVVKDISYSLMERLGMID